MKDIKLPSREQKQNIVFFLLLATVFICIICLLVIFCAHNYVPKALFDRLLPQSMILGAALIALAINTKHTS